MDNIYRCISKWLPMTFIVFLTGMLLLSFPATGLPQSTGYLCWGPHEFDISSPHQAMWDEIGGISDYIAYVWEETSVPNPSATRCTLPQLLSRLSSGKGVVLYAGHGAAGALSNYVAIETYTDEDSRDDDLDGYIGQGYNVLAINPKSNLFGIYLSNTHTSAWCTSFYPSRHGVSFSASCLVGSSHGYNAFNSKTSFGYSTTIYMSDARTDIEGIFSRMNGTVGLGAYLTTYQAHANYNDPYSPPTIYRYGDMYEKLFPYVSQASPSGSGVGTLWSDGYVYVSGGVAFIDRMDPNDTFSQGYCPTNGAISFSTGSMPSHPTPVSPYTPSSRPNPAWVEIYPGSNWTQQISFVLKAPPSTTVTVTVSGYNKAYITSGSLYIDGDKIAPNNDDFQYTFTTRSTP